MKKGETIEIVCIIIQIILLAAMILTLFKIGPIGFLFIIPMALMERCINKSVCICET